MKTTAANLRPKQHAAVVSLLCGQPLLGRLLSLGITPGAEIAVKKAAPFGDPIELEVRGSRLGIRRAEAAQIVVETFGKEKRAVWNARKPH